MLGEEPAELGLEHAEGGRQEPRVQAGGVLLLEPLELAGEVGDEARVGEVAVPEVRDDVGEPLRGEAAVVGEEAERGLELREHGEVPREVPGERAAREERGLKPVHGVEDLKHGGGGPSVRSMSRPATASASCDARIGSAEASIVGRRARIPSTRAASCASARPSVRDWSTPARSA